MTEIPAPQMRYRYVPYGGSVEEHDRFGIAQKIRRGDIDGATHLAIAGTDHWQPAASFPELARYFELVAARPDTSAGVVAVPAPPRTVESMGHRIVAGLAYPIAGGQIVTLVALSVLSAIPLISLLATLASTVIVLDIVRRSADGHTKMSTWIDTSNPAEMFRLYFRVLFVTLVSLAPLIAATLWAILAMYGGTVSPVTAMLVLIVAAVFGAVYYPACLATVAVWDNVVSALNPFYIFRVINIVSVDYFLVILIWFVANLAIGFTRFFSPLRMIPIVGSVFSAFLSLYVLFYASHLLGWAVYRHAPELGWE
ncbi:MAG TPA: hypothetical protein VJZ76_06820 [Thermoanaerobaculia bacterium]|nr:hypothetical protein [Thermoanaerobaculia bacterium]